MTLDEYREILMPADEHQKYYNHTKLTKKFPKKLSRKVVPDSFDWRSLNLVSQPKHQYRCGSCWAFASVCVFF